MKDTISVILGGGQGTRLYPLTKERSKPAVPIGGKYRLIDIPITNSLRSGLNRIFILTQFNSESLNKHVIQTYRFDSFHSGFVNILAAEQTAASKDWYQGTADAVRKNLQHIFAYRNVEHVLILSGDHVYKMDYQKLIDFHRENKHDISVCVYPVTREEVSAFGIMKVNNGLITDFVEKPKDPAIIDQFSSADQLPDSFSGFDKSKEYLASMGVYLFNAEVLREMLNNSCTDFGKEIIPNSIHNKKVGAFCFNGYWEDVGTIKSFWKANLEFTSENPKFNLYEDLIYTNARYLPPSKVFKCGIEEALLGEGSIIQQAEIKNSIIGIRSVIHENVEIENSVILGSDYYEKDSEKQENINKNIIDIGIGNNCIIKNAIIDKNARIGENCKIINKDNIKHFDSEDGSYYIRDYIVIIPKKAEIKPGTVI